MSHTIFHVQFVSEVNSTVLDTLELDFCPTYQKGEIIFIKRNKQELINEAWTSRYEVTSVGHHIMITTQTYTTIEYSLDVFVKVIDENYGVISNIIQ